MGSSMTIGVMPTLLYTHNSPNATSFTLRPHSDTTAEKIKKIMNSKRKQRVANKGKKKKLGERQMINGFG